MATTAAHRRTRLAFGVFLAIGIALLAAGLFMADRQVTAGGTECGSVWSNGTQTARLVEHDYQLKTEAATAGSEVAGGDLLYGQCQDALSGAKPPVYVLFGASAVFLAGAWLARRDVKRRS